MKEYVELAKKIAVEAGDLLTKYNLTFSGMEHQTPSPETIWDHLLGSLIRERLLRTTGIKAFSEEVSDPQQRCTMERFWWVDPIDGTRSFTLNQPSYCVSIGLVDRCRPVVGVIYQPHASRKVLYSAWEQGGAYCEKPRERGQKKIRVSRHRRQNLMGTLGTSDTATMRKLYKFFGISAKKPVGGFTSKVMMIASGESDLYMKFGDRSNEWDTCAAEVILREAGGKITDMQNRNLRYNNENPVQDEGIVASNGYEHDYMIELLQQYLQDHNNSRR